MEIEVLFKNMIEIFMQIAFIYKFVIAKFNSKMSAWVVKRKCPNFCINCLSRTACISKVLESSKFLYLRKHF